jgi:hypothetical protein
MKTTLLAILLFVIGAASGYWLDRSLRHFAIQVHATCARAMTI